jgi:hypothetical protein
MKRRERKPGHVCLFKVEGLNYCADPEMPPATGANSGQNRKNRENRFPLAGNRYGFDGIELDWMGARRPIAAHGPG